MGKMRTETDLVLLCDEYLTALLTLVRSCGSIFLNEEDRKASYDRT